MQNSDSETPKKRVAVIGGGITGLSAMLKLGESSFEIQATLFESSNRVGGSLKTESREGFLLEHGPDMFTKKEPEAFELCQQIGFDKELIGTNSENRRALIGYGNETYPVPDGFSLLVPTKSWPVMTSGLLSVSGRVRLLAERFKPPRRSEKDESLKSFAIRRFGKQAFQRLIQPLVAGIYTADPAKLSMQATMRQFVEMEKTYGSIIKGALRSNRRSEKSAGARYELFVAPRRGMESLVDAIVEKLPDDSIKLNSPVQRISKTPNGWTLRIKESEQEFDGLIVTTPARIATKLFEYGFAKIAGLLNKIEYAGSAVILQTFERRQIKHPLNAFGIVFPTVEKSPLIACSFASQKYALRAPQDKILLRTFVGGALNPEILSRPDQEIEAIVSSELSKRLVIDGNPIFSIVARWPDAMPQYHVGHLKLVSQIDAEVARQDGLELAGNAYQGVGIPACVRSGQQAAERLVNAVIREN